LPLIVMFLVGAKFWVTMIPALPPPSMRLFLIETADPPSIWMASLCVALPPWFGSLEKRCVPWSQDDSIFTLSPKILAASTPPSISTPRSVKLAPLMPSSRTLG
jgi:hypothetical protein